jgi:hypothetical protein
LLLFTKSFFLLILLEQNPMKVTLFSKTFRTVGLTALLSVVVGANMQQTAQADIYAPPFGTSEQAYMPCSEAFFTDPDFTYDPQFIGLSNEEFGVDQAYLDEIAAIDAEVTSFMVELDSPVGYIANKVNGVAVEIPAELEKEIYQAAFNANSNLANTRRRVEELNQQYGQYATFGQQISLVYSTDQLRRVDALNKAYYARVADAFTPEQKQAYQESIKSFGMCTAFGGGLEMGLLTKTIQVGVRPDLDARLREDTTGAIYFR